MSRLTVVLAFGLFYARAASATEPAITLSAPGDGCPSAELVRRQLLPLIDSRPIELSGPEAALAVVRDDGDRYAITVGKAQRDVVDASRNCLERARVAAVFIAMNLPPLERTEAPLEKPPQPERVAPPLPPPPAPEPSSSFGLQGRFETALTPEYGALSLGVSVGPSLAFGSWELALLLGFTGPTTLSGLGPSEAESVELVRFPARLLLAYLWTAGAIELGPEIGAFFGVVRIRGDQVPEPETSVRVEGGALGGVLVRWRPRERFAVAASADFLFSPYRYDLLVGPARKLGQTPATWLNAGLALAYTF
jgi:hypothetical protein